LPCSSSSSSSSSSSPVSSVYSAVVDLSYNFHDVLPRKKHSVCTYTYIWVACHYEYYKRLYFDDPCCCFCCDHSADSEDAQSLQKKI
jgi:hypothetical protein